MRIVALVLTGVVIALVVNAFLVHRDSHDATPFAGGRVLTIDGPDLNVRDYGPDDERAVVLLHGYLSSIEWWEQVAPALAAPGHRVVAIDLVGHGGSEATTADDDYGASGQATAVSRALDALGIHRAALVGHSMGGHIATLLAEREPERVERVVVIDTQGGPGLKDMPAMKTVGCWPLVGAVMDRFRGVDAIAKGSLQAGFAEDFPPPALAHRSLERATHRTVCRSTAATTMNDERAVAERLAALDKPVLVIWGEHDTLAPSAANIAKFTEAGLTPRVVAGSGHSPQVERPEAVVELVGPFVA
ncbi:alpha/beta fold hydrolase [Nocardia caishijiensis]|uniref:alpha/beta fold hydrolase n=1 Tax=Nocardia caishijiensis TaxID=184756 RepID=UPI001F192FA6|nr:alpha/beta fold hydrolase [Nocardia caishijiensis]